MKWLEQYLPVCYIEVNSSSVQIWNSRRLTQSDVPQKVVRDESGEIVEVGEKALILSSRLPAGWSDLAPFWAETIQDREGLFLVCGRALAELRQKRGVLAGRRVVLLLRPTISLLQKKWLQQTFRELGCWWLSEQDYYVWKNKGPFSDTAAFLDIDTSVARWLIYSADRPVQSVLLEEFSQEAFWLQVQQIYRVKKNWEFVSTLYTDNWQRKHMIKKANEEEISEIVVDSQLVKQVGEVFGHNLSQEIQRLCRTLPESLQQEIMSQGFQIIGEGKNLPFLKLV